MPKVLSNIEIKELEGWLTEHNITTYKMHRELSDGVAVATLIKKHYPRLVEMTHYPACLNTQLKLINWQTLNKNVLSKLGLFRTPQTLEKLAMGTPGVIECLMYDLMQLEEIAKAKNEKDLKDFTENSKVLTVTLQKKVNGEMVPINEKMIRFSEYEDAVKQSQEKDKKLKEYQERISKLETLLGIKDTRSRK